MGAPVVVTPDLSPFSRTCHLTGSGHLELGPATSTELPCHRLRLTPEHLPTASDVYREMVSWYQDASIPELLAGYAATLVELRRRGVLRTNNAPVGDYAEWLLAHALGGTLAHSTSAKSYDLTLPDRGRVQVKARLVTDPPGVGQLQTSPFRSWDFEAAALMLFRADSYAPVLTVLAPVDVVRSHAKFRRHVNGEIVFIRPPLTVASGVDDVTAEVAAAHTQLLT